MCWISLCGARWCRCSMWCLCRWSRWLSWRSRRLTSSGVWGLLTIRKLEREMNVNVGSRQLMFSTVNILRITFQQDEFSRGEFTNMHLAIIFPPVKRIRHPVRVLCIEKVVNDSHLGMDTCSCLFAFIFFRQKAFGFSRTGNCRRICIQK